MPHEYSPLAAVTTHWSPAEAAGGTLDETDASERAAPATDGAATDTPAKAAVMTRLPS